MDRTDEEASTTQGVRQRGPTCVKDEGLESGSVDVWNDDVDLGAHSLRNDPPLFLRSFALDA